MKKSRDEAAKAYHLLVHRTDTGECIEDQAFYLMGKINLQMSFAGPTISVRNRSGSEIGQFRQRGFQNKVSVDRGVKDPIAPKQLARRLHNKEGHLKDSGDLVRFPPNDEDNAAQHLIKTIIDVAAKNDIVYVADPYFFRLGMTNDLMGRLLIGLMDAAQDTTLRILHGLPINKIAGGWDNFEPTLRRNVQAKGVLRANHDPGEMRPGFHDRFVAAASGELLFTHSINGWHKDGVTFVQLAQGLYFAEAERLWVEENTGQFLIEELW